MFNIIPTHYDLSLFPDFKDFSCPGSVTIYCNVSEPVTGIILHAVDIEFHKTMIQYEGGAIETNVVLDPEKGEAKLNVPHKLNGNISISIDFTSRVASEFHGLYRCSYEQNGTEKIMMTSQFEEEDARRVFPCFDTPALKATFNMELNIPETMTAVFCTELINEEPADKGMKCVRFLKTPVMATYVLYIGIGELQMLSKKDGNLTARLFSLFDNIDQGAWTLDAMIDAVRYMENKTGVAYPLAKIDYISVPGFPFGAMENYGAIAAQDLRVNIDPEKTPPNDIAYNYMIVYHEVVHMWLGNLVTPENWNDMWLNESFTEFLGEKMVKDINPGWQADYFDSEYMGRRARILDGGDYVGAVYEPDYDREFNMADIPLVYSKGNFIMDMFCKRWGEDSFFGGISHVMKTVPYKSVSNEQYTRLFSEGSGHNFKDDVMPWIIQKGIPELMVAQRENELILTQRRFRYGNTVSGDIWPIPLELRYRDSDRSETTRSILMNEELVNLSLPAGTTAVQCSNGYTGYYRIKYDDGLLESFLILCREGNVSAGDRARFIDDLFAFVRRGDYSIDQAFCFMEDSFSKEVSPAVILELERNLLDVMRISPDHSDQAKQFISDRVSQVIELAEKAAWGKQTFGETMYWEEILGYSFAFDCGRSLKLSIDAYEEFLATGKCNSILFSSAVSAAAYTNRISIDDLIIKIENDSTSAAERFIYLKALVSYRDQSSIKRCLEYCLNDLRVDLSKRVFGAMLETPWIWEAAWDICVNQADSLNRFSVFTRGYIALTVIPLAALKNIEKTHAFLDNLSRENQALAHVARIVKESIGHDLAMYNRNR